MTENLKDPNSLYIDRKSMLALDACVSVCLKASNHVALQSRTMVMLQHQSVAAVLLPQSLYIGLSIESLLKQGYLLSAAILMRPMWERIGTAFYLKKNKPKIAAWRSNWNGKRPPSLKTLLDAIDGEIDEVRDVDGISTLHGLVHGNWEEMGCSISSQSSSQVGVSAGPIADAPEHVDHFALQTAIGCHVVAVAFRNFFPRHVSDCELSQPLNHANDLLLEAASQMLSEVGLDADD
ncbi:MAG: hypothetical protein AAF916_07855 [Planctomycetota bacterium]